GFLISVTVLNVLYTITQFLILRFEENSSTIQKVGFGILFLVYAIVAFFTYNYNKFEEFDKFIKLNAIAIVYNTAIAFLLSIILKLPFDSTLLPAYVYVGAIVINLISKHFLKPFINQ
ncbi:hypothetical protein LJC13_03340, partial [Peptostreptococcaceae bacterium OttesenSCG-928-C18]|nr:hypothetical protein [Peptostreptococcaceae bacterium OttesenSCG-928-C18]